MNLTKEVKDIYYITLKKETEDDTRAWPHLPGSWCVRINLLKMTLLWRAIYRFHEITLKMPLPIFIELEERLQ
jgi:hypothetical protein